MKNSTCSEVLIVGAGPIGLSTAIMLTMQGTKCRIIDKDDRDPGKQYFSRALGLHARTLEIFADIGVIKDCMIKGRIINGLGFYFDGHKAASISFRHLPSGYPFMLSLPQCDTESILEQRLNQLGVFVTRSTELLDLNQNQDYVTATIKNASEQTIKENFAYVVGADGFHSKVRKLCAIPFDGAQYEESWLLAETYLSRDFPSDEANVIISNNSNLAVVPMPDGKIRVTGPDTSSKRDINDVDLSVFNAALKEMGTLENIEYREPEQVTRFRVHRRLARSYRKNRVFLVGDAAHVHSPGGGQGLNTGMLDAYNLAWRLSLATNAKASVNILDGYNTERRRAGEITVFGTDKALQLLNAANSPIKKSVRNLMLPLVLKSSYGDRLAANMSQIFTNYRHCFQQEEKDYFNCSLALGDPLPRVVPPIDVAGDPLNLRPNGKFTVIFFCSNLSQQSILRELKKLRGLPVVKAGLCRTAIVTQQPGVTINSKDELTISDTASYVHSAFGMNEAGFYIARPDSFINSRMKTEDIAFHAGNYFADLFGLPEKAQQSSSHKKAA